MVDNDYATNGHNLNLTLGNSVIASTPITIGDSPPVTASLETKLTPNDIFGSIIILTLLTIIAICLIYFCTRKYCLTDEDTASPTHIGDFEPLTNENKDSLASTTQTGTLPSIQNAIDGTRSPISDGNLIQAQQQPQQQTTVLPSAQLLLPPPPAQPPARLKPHSPGEADRRRRSPGNRRKRASPALRGETNATGNAAQQQQLTTSRRQVALGQAMSRLTDGQTRRLNSTIGTQKRSPRSTISSSQGAPLGPTELRDKSLTRQGTTQSHRNVSAPIAQRAPRDLNSYPMSQTASNIQLQEAPITADVIKRHIKETNKEHTLFKSPSFYD